MKTTELFSDFLRYAALNVAGMVGLSCYILADTFFVSRGLGTQGLAAESGPAHRQPGDGHPA